MTSTGRRARLRSPGHPRPPTREGSRGDGRALRARPRAPALVLRAGGRADRCPTGVGASGGELADRCLLAVPARPRGERGRARGTARERLLAPLRGGELEPGHPDVLQGALPVVRRRGIAV